MSSWEVRTGDCLDLLGAMPDRSVHMVATSPPYWGLRDYGTAAWEGGDEGCDHSKDARGRRNIPGSGHPGPLDHIAIRGSEPKKATKEPYGAVCGKCGAQRVDQQLGLEPTPDEYVANLVAVFRQVGQRSATFIGLRLRLRNPELADYEATKGHFRQLGLERRKAREDYERHARARAQAEHDYQKRRAERLTFYRTEGKGVGESEILAKGDVAPIALTRDIEDTLAKVAQMRIAELEADRAGVNRLAQWTERIDPAGVGD